jgi:hypothetical protein
LKLIQFDSLIRDQKDTYKMYEAYSATWVIKTLVLVLAMAWLCWAEETVPANVHSPCKRLSVQFAWRY